MEKITIILYCYQIPEQYDDFINNFNNNNDDLGISLQKRKQLAAKGFTMTSNYDNHIQQFFNETDIQLKYGMNPHQDKTHVNLNGNPFTVINGTLGMINIYDFIHGG